MMCSILCYTTLSQTKLCFKHPELAPNGPEPTRTHPARTEANLPEQNQLEPNRPERKLLSQSIKMFAASLFAPTVARII